jgi:hypothetical protein
LNNKKLGGQVPTPGYDPPLATRLSDAGVGRGDCSSTGAVYFGTCAPGGIPTVGQCATGQNPQDVCNPTGSSGEKGICQDGNSPSYGNYCITNGSFAK